MFPFYISSNGAMPTQHKPPFEKPIPHRGPYHTGEKFQSVACREGYRVDFFKISREFKCFLVVDFVEVGAYFALAGFVFAYMEFNKRP